MREATWYWRIWWWIGYHGVYQINWFFKEQMARYRAYRERMIDEKDIH